MNPHQILTGYIQSVRRLLLQGIKMDRGMGTGQLPARVDIAEWRTPFSLWGSRQGCSPIGMGSRQQALTVSGLEGTMKSGGPMIGTQFVLP